MKIEKVNDNQIRCTLTREDLEDRHIKISELAYGSAKAKSLFKDMVEQANYEFGFETNDIPLMVEAIPLPSESIVLIITKVEYPDELDTRFSKFSEADDDFTDLGNAGQPPVIKGAADILELFERIKKENEKTADSEQGTDDITEEQAEADVVKLFVFDKFDDVRRISHVLDGFYSGDKAVAVTNYIVDLFANPNFVMDNNEGSLGLAGLKDGSVNAYFNGNWNYDAVKENLGEENVGVAALPTINIGGKDCQLKAFLGSKAIGVNPNCKNQEVAVKLAAFLGSEDAQLAHFKLRAQAPVNKDLVTNEEIAADPVAAAMAKVSSDCSVAQPIIDMAGYWDAATPFGDAFQNGAEGQITKDNAAQKTEDFNTQLNDSLK